MEQKNKIKNKAIEKTQNKAVEVVNTSTGEITNGKIKESFNCFELPKTNGIISLGQPTQYRPDCQAGKFKIKTDLLGDTLKMEIINVKELAGEFFDYDRQEWLEVTFIDELNTISVILFKTESMDNFMSMIKRAIAEKLPLASLKVTGKMEQRFSKRLNTKYFAVSFSYELNTQERQEEILNFVQSNPHILEYSLFLRA